MEKQLFVVFSDNKSVFTHLLLNILDLNAKGYDVGVIFESSGCKLIDSYKEKDKFKMLKEKGLIFAICEVCAKAMGVLESAKEQGLPINGELHGHPPLEKWIREDYHIMII